MPEPRTGKTRVHLDLRLPRRRRAAARAGAALVREPRRHPAWWVLADPEGNVFCAMPPAPPEWGAPPVEVPTPFELVVDCADPQAPGAVVGGPHRRRGRTRARAAVLVGRGRGRVPLSCSGCSRAVPEPKTVKNRMHWDVVLRDDSPQALLDAGATLLREPDADETDWWVLADPEGNEFCAFVENAAG